MPGRVASCATALGAAALVCLFVAARSSPPHAPPASAVTKARELPPVASASQAAASSASPLHPVIVQHPSTLGVIDTEIRDVRGATVGVACATCHASESGPALAARPGAPEDFHAGVELEHGALSCGSCHHPDDRTRLRLADGTSLPLAEVMQLCGQCHGPQFRDYTRGSHGGMAGYWDRRRGPQLRNSCVACHAAHRPSYPLVVPAAPPRDRFLPPHPAPRPATRLPGRSVHGAAKHD